MSIALSIDKTAEVIACSRDPSLPYCRALGFKTSVRNRREDREKDETACRELRLEYRNICTRDKLAMENDEFCAAYENVCFQIPKGEPDQPLARRSSVDPSTTVETPSVTDDQQSKSLPSTPKKDYTEFCKEYKQRFLYVCPGNSFITFKIIIFF